MPTNVRPDTKRKLFISPETLNPGETSDSFVIQLPFSAQYVAVSNSTVATLNVAIGRVMHVPPDAISVQLNNSISTEIPDTEIVTVFWNSDQPVPQPTSTNQNRIIFWFSNEPIQLQVGSLSTGETAQVSVTNTVTVISEGFDGTDYHAVRIDDSGNQYVTLTNNQVIIQSGHVNVDSLPELPAGANNIGHVNVDSIEGVPLSASSGITNTNQVSVGTGPTPIFNGVVNGKRIRIANLDATNVLYLGTSTVSPSSGYPVFPNGEFIQDITPGQAITIYGVGSSALNAAYAVIN